MNTIPALFTVVVGAAGLASCAIGNSDRPAAGYVPDARTATRIAEAILIPIYGEREIHSERPFDAQLHGNVWRVHGTLRQPSSSRLLTVGGTAEVEIDRRTGTILRVSHGE